MTFNRSGNYPIDSDGFTPPTYGGPVAVKYGSFTRANVSGSAATLFTLPKGAVIVGWSVNITTAFNAAGNDYLDLGDGTTANRFANDLNLATATQVVTGFDPDELFVELTDETSVVATYVGDGAAGAATVCCFYIQKGA